VVSPDRGVAGAAKAPNFSVRTITFRGIGALIFTSVRQLNKGKLNSTYKHLLFQFFYNIYKLTKKVNMFLKH
jgi:hypothetical protein